MKSNYEDKLAFLKGRRNYNVSRILMNLCVPNVNLIVT